MAETACLLRTLSICFPLKPPSHLPINVGFLSFLTLGHCSSLNKFVPDSEISSSHRLINMKSHTGLQYWISRLSIVSDSFLLVQSQDRLTLNRIVQFFICKNPFQDQFRTNFACCDNRAWSHRTSKSCTSSFCERRLNKSESPCTASRAPVARKCSQIMGVICLPLQKTVVFLSALLFDTDSFSEVHKRVEQLFQCRRNHRIKHIVAGEIVHHNRSRCHKFVN